MGQGSRRHWLKKYRYQGQVLGGAMDACRQPRRGSLSHGLALIRQSWGNDCGPAALATVAAHYGCQFAYDDLAAEMPLDSRGTDLLALSRVAKLMGFRPHGVKASYGDISHCPFPAIAHIHRWFGGGHFVVVYRWSPTHVVVGDPAVGLRVLSRRAFCRRSSGLFLIIEPPSFLEPPFPDLKKA